MMWSLGFILILARVVHDGCMWSALPSRASMGGGASYIICTGMSQHVFLFFLFFSETWHFCECVIDFQSNRVECKTHTYYCTCITEEEESEPARSNIGECWTAQLSRRCPGSFLQRTSARVSCVQTNFFSHRCLVLRWCVDVFPPITEQLCFLEECVSFRNSLFCCYYSSSMYSGVFV